MERNVGKGIMEQQKKYEQIRYNSSDMRNDGVGTANPRFFQDPSASINTSVRPPEFGVPVVGRPVLNYSIQTGEEFSLEFMRDRVNSRPQLVPTFSGDHNAPTGYMDLKGIRGISHAGSESGSDISMVNSVEKRQVEELNRKGTSVGDPKGYYESVRSIPRTSSRNDSNRGYASSGASDGSSTKVKFLCSFGGKILPRPSDGKLRYVGGDTRIIRLSRDISWQELMEKTLTIYNQPHTIKYQLPGEDLDALVSVSSDEDLQNMMEEYSVLENGGSQKLRMFLFSTSDLDDVQYGLGSTEGDSEIQYVVAVNGIDLGSRKSSLGLASSSGNNLDELMNLNVKSDSTQIAAEAAGTSSASFSENITASAIQSSPPNVPDFPQPYELNAHPYQGQLMHQVEVGQHLTCAVHHMDGFHDIDGKGNIPFPSPLQHNYGSDPSNYAPMKENLVLDPLYGPFAPQLRSFEQQLHSGSNIHNQQIHTKDMKLKSDSSIPKLNESEVTWSLEKEAPLQEVKPTRDKSLQKINESDKSQPRENELAVRPCPFDNSESYSIPKDETSIVDSGSHLLPSKINKKQQDSVENLVPTIAVNEGCLSKVDEDEMKGGAFTPGHGDSKANQTEFSYPEPPVLPLRIFHSERIPREQAELNRLSKSDDSFGSQLLISHAHSDISQQITESADKLHGVSVASEIDQSVSSGKLLTANLQDGPAQLEMYKVSANNTTSMCSNVPDEGLRSKFQKSALKLSPNDDHEIARLAKDSITGTETAFVGLPAASQSASAKQLDNSAPTSPEINWGEMAAGRKTCADSEGPAQALDWTEKEGEPMIAEESSGTVGTSVQGDILVDINDHFPRDFLSDIFSKARLSQDSSQISPLHHDGAGVSLNMENHEPKHWSFFQKLAQGEFSRKDVSLMDQDHLGFPSPLTDLEERAAIDYSFPPLNTEKIADGNMVSHIDFNDGIQPESSGVVGPATMDAANYNSSLLKDRKLDILETGLPIIDLPLVDLQIIKNEDLEELRELGSGTFGTVYHGKWRGTDVAIKRIKRSCFTGRSSEQERLTVEFWREAEILSKLHHPNVVAFYGVVQDGPGGTLATVTEYMVNGSLRHVLLSKERHLDRRKKLIIAMDAAFGMEYLHSKNIVHFDLKCDNLLVNLKDPLRPICKVGDFGLSKIKRNTLVTGGVRGTLPWMAPELLNDSSSRVSEKVDVFSFGIVLWEILTGEEPYANMHYGAIIGA
ncbi:Serine-threonine/tyrosine-protein kinase, catalytic domain [Dillenia turbinata]|uniref:Serine-threonine/tyrosine-protein kinase, catalytic domain n=1 Tax=Dillenia turbinata TaxID=194707 RepID=A0AAN8VBG5_9MAGN